MASTYLTKTPSSAGNRKTWTYSAWIKLGSTATMQLFSAGADSSNYNSLRITQTGLRATNYNSSNTWNIRTNALLRDTNAWYHIVLRVDTTQSTASDRARLYINGELQTSLLESSYPAQNQDEYVNNTNLHAIGTTVPVNSNNFDGSMSHIHLCDGYSYDASAFGSTDSTTGEWKINTSPSVTYGNNGFFILKDGNSGTDQSGQGNNLTVSGTLTKTEDCPSNVFATFNPLATFANITLTNGNNTYTLNAGTWESTPSTLALPSSGKYYAEFKWNASSTSAQYMMVGVDSPQLFSSWSTNYPGYTSVGYAYGWDGDKRNNASNSSYGAAWGATSIIGVAIDMDNKKLYFHKDGVYQNSGVPTSGSTGTGALSLTEDEYYLIVSGYKNTENPSIHANFGNGYFGTTAVATQGTNASGNGIFEFDVPTGYTALSTKGLNL
jgi:hypothetical protein